MVDRLFIVQQQLESWLDDGKVTFEGDVLTLLEEKAVYELEPAVRILSLLGGEDSAGLLGKTLSVAELTSTGAEHYRDSVIAGDTAYQCEEGFLGTSSSPAPPAATSPRPAPAAPPPASGAGTAAIKAPSAWPPPAAARAAAPVAAVQPVPNATPVRVPLPPPPAGAQPFAAGAAVPARAVTAAAPAPAGSATPASTSPAAAAEPSAPPEAAAPAPGTAVDTPANESDFDLLAEFMLKHM